MDNEKDIDRLFHAMDSLVTETKETNKAISQTNVELAGLRGDISGINIKVKNLEKNKASKTDITKDVEFHKMAYHTNSSSSSGIFKGTSAANKSLLIGAFVSFLSVLGMYIKSDMEIRNLEAKAKVENIQNEANK